MTEEELNAIVDNEMDSAMGREGNSISTERATAWRYYMSEPLGNEVEGSSQARTSDVSDIVDGIMPSLLRIFASVENLLDFEPQSAEDEPLAEQESDATNYIFWRRNPAFMLLYTWFFDALVQKNGIVKAWWNTSKKVTRETYEGLTELELQALLDDEQIEPVEQEERTEIVVQELPTDTGLIETEVEVTVYDVVLQRTEKGRISIDNVPPEEFRISSDARSSDPSSARMVGQERPITRSELVEMGYERKLVDSLEGYSPTATSGEERRARRKHSEEDDLYTITDRSMETVQYREVYIKVDFDDDGIAELRQVVQAGNVILSNEPVDRQPYHCIAAKPLPHKFFGRSIADLVMDIQEITTTLLRQTLDNLYRSNSPGHLLWDQAIGESTMDDLLSSRPGRTVITRRPPGEAYSPLTVPFVANHSFSALEYFDKLKRERTGVSSDAEGLTPEMLKNIQSGVMARALDIAQGKVEAIARIIAETGMKTLFLHIHELMLKHSDRKQTMRLRGKFVDVDPTEWRERDDMTCQIGLGLGSSDTNLLHLEAIWAKQKDIIGGGGLGSIVTPRNIYQTAAAIVKNARLKEPDLFFTDPGDMEVPDPNAEQDEQKALQRGLIEVEAQKNQLTAQRMQLDAQEKSFKLEQKQAEMEAKHAAEIERLQTERERMENDFMVRMEQIANQLTEMELKYGQNVPGSKV